MKLKLYSIILLFFAAAAISGCVPSLDSTPTPAVTVPIGTFNGKFGYLHRHTDLVPYDTVTANITLTLTSAGAYTVTGDTTTVHAGSYGAFAIDATYMSFIDKTFPLKTTPVKKHLSGSYLYTYDGTTLKLLSSSSDTLSYQYQLTKAN